MMKSVYDPDEDGVIAVAQTEAKVKKVPALAFSDTVQHNNAAERWTITKGYSWLKEIRLPVGGLFGATFEMKSSQAGVSVYGRIYRNDLAYGTERSTDLSSYVEYQEALVFGVGDLYQIYGSSNEVQRVYVRNQTICGRDLPDYEDHDHE